jgi:hypothetical protein
MSAGGDQSWSLRYDLQPGDHLVYRERLDRRVEGEKTAQRAVAEWSVHVVATGRAAGGVITGFQRNRTSARLVRATENGHDVTAATQATFDAQLAQRPAIAADANWIDGTGRGLLPWPVIREWRSLLLPAMREFEPLPDAPVKPGVPWTGAGLLGYKMTASACPEANDDCVLVAGESSAAQIRLWYSRRQGLATRIVFDARYETPGNQPNREEVTFELVERRRGERPEQWLASPELRVGTLAALHIGQAGTVAPQRLFELLDDLDTDTVRRALAVAWQWDLAPPPASTLGRLLDSANPRIRTLAARFATRLPPAAGRDLLARAATDADLFVREAAGGVPVASPASGQNPVGGCAAATDAWRAGRRVGREQPGATLRAMTSPGFVGRPYALRVPDDYTGAGLVPVVVYLSGGGGVAVAGAQTAESPLADTGYLAVYPHAGGMWWDDRSRDVVRALLDEILATFPVDTNRVYLGGASNGGTGTLFYATRWPDRFAALIPTEAATVGPEQFPVFLSSLGGLPILLQHGKDDRVIPVEAGMANRDLISKGPRTAPFEFVLLENRGHDITIATDAGRSLKFIEGRTRDPLPRAFVFETTNLLVPRRYWVELADKRGGTARIDARWTPEGGIDLATRNVRRLRLLLRRDMLPADGPLVVRLNGAEAFRGVVREDCSMFARTLAELADPGLAYSAVVELEVGR